MILFKHILARILKTDLDFFQDSFSRFCAKILKNNLDFCFKKILKWNRDLEKFRDRTSKDRNRSLVKFQGSRYLVRRVNTFVKFQTKIEIRELLCPNRPISKFFKIQFSFQDFLETKIKIIFQDFGTESWKWILKKNQDHFSRFLPKYVWTKSLILRSKYRGALRAPV